MLKNLYLLQSLQAHPDCTDYTNSVNEEALTKTEHDFFAPLNKKIDELNELYEKKIAESRSHWLHTVRLGDQGGNMETRVKVATEKIHGKATKAITKIKAISDQRGKYSDLYSAAKAAEFKNAALNTKFLDEQRELCAELGTEMWMELAYFDFVIRSMATEAGLPFPHRKCPQIRLPEHEIEKGVKDMIKGKGNEKLYKIWQLFNSDREELRANYNVNDLYAGTCNVVCKYFAADVVEIKKIFGFETKVFEERSKRIDNVTEQNQTDVQLSLSLFAAKIDELMAMKEFCSDNAVEWMEDAIANKHATGTAGAFFQTVEDFYKIKKESLAPMIQTIFKIMHLIDYILNENGV